MSKLLTVFGATGVQGGSVIRAALENPSLGFKLRAITRDPSKPNAQALVSKGVEAVKADLNNSESLKEAVAGSYAVFAVTNFWESASKEVEVKQGRAIADACKAAGVSHLVWSSLAHTTKLTNGVLSHISHFDGKAEIGEYMESIKGDDMAVTLFMPGFYMSNIKGSIKVGPDGTPTYAMPWEGDKTQVPLFDTGADSGKFVIGILSQDPKSVNGRKVHAVSEWITPNEIVSVLNKETGNNVAFKQVPEKVFQSFMPAPVAEELTENMVLVRDYSYYGPGSEKEQAKHDEVLGGQKLTTWAEFVKANGPWEWK